MPDIEGLKSFLMQIQSCCLAHPKATYFIEHIVEVDAWVESEPDGPAGGAIFRTEDGVWWALEESQDYTGHG